MRFEDTCEGGGYVLWTSLVICQENPIFRILLILLAVFFMIYLVLFMASASDGKGNNLES